MALIKIHSDGTFESVAAVGANHTKPPAKMTYATAIKAIKEVIKRADRDLVTTAKIDGLKATREKERGIKLKLKTSKVAADIKARVLARQSTKIDKITDAIDKLTAKLSAGRYLKPAVLKKRQTSAATKLKKFEALLAKQKAKPAAPKTPKPKVTLPMLDGPKPRPGRIIKTPQFREAGTHNAPTRTPRVPKDPAAAFGREAKLAAGSISRGIRSELRDHGKTALVPVANRASAQAPKAVPSGKKADTATTHATKPARGAIGNTLTEIKKIKASIATGELKGAKLVRAREELEKQRAALRGLRAGKTAVNQRAIVKPGTAKHMGGAKKITGKPSGMGDATKSGVHEKVKERIEKLEDRLDDRHTRGGPSGGAAFVAWEKKNDEMKAKIDALKASIGIKVPKNRRSGY